MLCGMWDLSSRPSVELVPPAMDAQSLNNWTIREVPRMCLVLFFFFKEALWVSRLSLKVRRSDLDH